MRNSSLNALDGERGMLSVNEHRPSAAKRGLIFCFLLAFIGLAFGIGYWKFHKNFEHHKIDATEKELQITNAVPAHIFSIPPPTKPVSPSLAFATAPPLPRVNQVLDKSESALMVNDEKTTAAHENERAENTPLENQNGHMSRLLTSTSTPMRFAGTLGNRNFILAKGSSIPCALQTKLDTTVPGMTSCVTTSNIFSDNGKVLLMERGSTVSGEHRSNMRQGMARIFVLWDRIKTPNGIVIQLDSPGTDALGGSGLPGYVDNHFWQRFGGAMMLSLVDDVARDSATSVGGTQQNFNFNSSSEATQQMAAEALKNTINIPPTLYRNQGGKVNIYVARDLNFSSVYDVE